MDQDKTVEPSAVNGPAFEQAGQATIRDVMPAVAFWMGIVVVCSLTRVVSVGWLPVMAVHLGLAACLLAAALVRQRIPGRLLALTVTGVFFAVAAVGLPYFGLLGGGYGFTLVACLFAAICCGPPLAYGLAAAYAIMTVAMASLATLADYRFPLDAESYLYAPTSWALHVASVFVLVVPAVHFVGRSQSVLADKNEALALRSKQLTDALGEVKTLRALVPVCDCCKKIRDDPGYWEQVEAYRSGRGEALPSQGCCPACAARQLDATGGGRKTRRII